MHSTYLLSAAIAVVGASVSVAMVPLDNFVEIKDSLEGTCADWTEACEG